MAQVLLYRNGELDTVVEADVGVLAAAVAAYVVVASGDAGVVRWAVVAMPGHRRDRRAAVARRAIQRAIEGTV